MNLEETVTDLPATMGQLSAENDNLRMMITLVKENKDLRSRLESFIDDYPEQQTVSWASFAERKPHSQLKNTRCEEILQRDVHHTRLKGQHRASSPSKFQSFRQSFPYKNTDTTQGIQAENSSEVESPKRLLGEIAYQLNRRIMSYVFRGQKRLYGFTVQNIPDKIKELSVNPLTGDEDEDYRLFLSQRYNKLMESLAQLGYKRTFHPAFSEFIANKYGLMKKSNFNTLGMNYNNSNFLRKLITTTAPQHLQKDIEILLNCLCKMAERDNKTLLP